MLLGDEEKFELSQEFKRHFKRELKHFEICLRIFEETCIKVVCETQQAVLERNIDHMCEEEQRDGNLTFGQLKD